MKIICLSDLHSHLIDIPSCDLLLIGGDINPKMGNNSGFQAHWFETTFKKWIESIDAKQIAIVFGNHDSIGEEFPEEIKKIFYKFPRHFNYLQDSGTKYENLNIWGSPWQLPFGLAFNLPEKKIEKKWELIPDNTDILLLHGPPYLYGDYSDYSQEHTGSPSLTQKIIEIKPKLVCCGHIHRSRGIYQLNDTIIANAALVNDKYEPINKPMIFELNDGKLKIIDF